MLFGSRPLEPTSRPEDVWYARAVMVGRQAWALKTRSERHRVWAKFQTFARRLHRLQDRAYTYEEVALVFLESHEQTLPSTRLQYAKILANLLCRYGESTPALTCYMQGLRQLGAMTTTHTAECATVLQIRTLLAVLEPPLAAAVSLAWRTASRWGDLWDLKRANFLLVTDTRIVVKWGRTKANRFGVANMASLVVVDSVVPMAEITRHLATLRPLDQFCSTTTDSLRRRLALVSATQGLTAHSLKNGAVDLLGHHALMRRFPLDLIPRVTKHASPLQQSFPAVTLHYLHNEVQRALLLDTHLVTVWLDPFRPENEPPLLC
jgi:hypothetical protein